MAWAPHVGGRQPESIGPRPRDVLEPVAGVAGGFLAMAAAAAVSLPLIGAGRIGALRHMVPAVVALAAGGSVDLGLAASGSLPISAIVHGGFDVRPLGVTVLGTLVIAAAFLVPLRRRPPLNGSALALRAASAVVCYLVLAGVAASMGHGTVVIDVSRPSSNGSSPTGSPGSGQSGLSGLRGLAQNLRGGGGQPRGPGLDPRQLLGAHPTITYRTDVATTELIGLLLVTGLLAVCWLASRRTPLPAAWSAVARVRPVVSAAMTVALGLLALGLLAGVAAGVVTGHAGQVTGAALLGLPNVIAAGLSLGFDVPWSMRTAGALGTRLLPALERRLPNEGLRSVYSGAHGRAWLGPGLLALVVLLVFGVLAAARAPRPPVSGGPRGALARAALRGPAAGVLTALAAATLTLLARTSAHLDISVLGLSLPAVTLDFAGSTGRALLDGLLAGAVAGFAGSLVVDLARRPRPGPPPDDPVDETRLTAVPEIGRGGGAA